MFAVNGGHLYPEIMLVNRHCGQAPTLKYAHAFLVLKIKDTGPEEKGEVIEQLRSCLLNDFRASLFGAACSRRLVKPFLSMLIIPIEIILA